MIGNKELIAELRRNDYVTAQELAMSFSVSAKTVRKALANLDKELKENGAFIEAKPSCGYSLSVTNQILFEEYLKILPKRQNDADEDCRKLLKAFLFEPGYQKMEDLADKLCLSRSTLQNRMRRVKAIIKSYDLQLNSRPNYGSVLRGREENIRECGYLTVGYSELGDAYIRTFFNDVIVRALRQNGIQMNMEDYEVLYGRLMVSFGRWKIGRFVEPSNMCIKNVFRDSRESKASSEIIQALGEELSLSIPKTEADYLSSLIMGFAMYKNEPIPEGRQVSQDIISQEIGEILRQIDNQYNTGFFRDQALIRSLMAHMLPLIARIQFQTLKRNPLREYIKASWPFEYELAVAFSNELKNRMDFPLNEDEISYIALHFSLANLKAESRSGSCHVLLICPAGNTIAELIKIRLLQKFSAYILDVEIYCFINISPEICQKYDLVIAVGRKDMLVECGNIVRISFPMSDGDLNILSAAFKARACRKRLTDFIHRDLYFRNVDGDNWQYVLKNLCDMIPEHYEKPGWLYDSLLLREHLAPTDVGGMMAIPHTMCHDFPQSFVVIGVLREPVLWGHNQVRLVFLFCLNTERGGELTGLYSDLVRLIENVQAQQKLIRAVDYAEAEGILKECVDDS